MGDHIFAWEVLEGLPPYGDPALPFSATGLGNHREGLVVRFSSPDSLSWTGNFQRGYGECETVVRHPNGRDVVVVAGGSAYVVDPAEKKVLRHFGADLQFAADVSSVDALVLGNGLWFESLTANGEGWRTRRISWDGIRSARVEGTELHGEAYSPFDDHWYAFTVDLINGNVSGGSYHGPT